MSKKSQPKKNNNKNGKNDRNLNEQKYVIDLTIINVANFIKESYN